MSLGAYAATRVAGSPPPAWGQRVQDDRRGQRGKNGSARPPGTHKLLCRVWRDGGTRASCDLFIADAEEYLGNYGGIDLYFRDYLVRRVSPTGIITTAAGGGYGEQGF